MMITVYTTPDQETFVESHIWNPWMSMEIFKTIHTDKEGNTKTVFTLYNDGDYETETKTIKEARAYIKKLRDSWKDDHPGEKVPWRNDRI